MKCPKFINKNRFYRLEHVEFAQDFQEILTDKEAKRLVKKIAQHYKHEPITVKFNGKRHKSGCADWQQSIIRLCHSPSAGLVAHELAHILTKSGHTFRSLKMLETILSYSRKKEFWKHEC